MKDAITATEKKKADVSQAIIEGGSEGLGKVITEADEDRAKTEKKEAKDLKKIGDDYTKEQMTAAKATDKAVNTEFKNEAAKASIKAFSKASLAQAEPEMSFEDQEEAA